MSRHVVCDVEDLPVGAHVIAPIGGKMGIGVFHLEGSMVALRNLCPHAGAPLCRGVLTGATVSDELGERQWVHEGEILKCPWHGWEFKLPEGVTLTDPPVRVKTYPVEVEDGKVIVDLGAPRRSGTAPNASA